MVERALHEDVGCHKMGRRVGAYGTEFVNRRGVEGVSVKTWEWVSAMLLRN